MISAIAAIGWKDGVLGKDNQLLWRIPADMKRFREITTGHPVIMGRKTWDSIPEQFRPLPDRTNIILTRQPDFKAEGALVCHSLAAALSLGKMSPGCTEVFIIGGGEIYAEALPFTDKIYLTIVMLDVEGDAFFPEYEGLYQEISREERTHKDFEYAWIDLVRT